MGYSSIQIHSYVCACVCVCMYALCVIIFLYLIPAMEIATIWIVSIIYALVLVGDLLKSSANLPIKTKTKPTQPTTMNPLTTHSHISTNLNAKEINTNV